MNSKLNSMYLADGIKRKEKTWLDDLADIIGAPRVYYRFRRSRINGDVLFVENKSDFDWIKSNHQRDLAKYFGVTRIEHTREGDQS